MRRIWALLLILGLDAHAAHRLHRKDFTTPAPLPPRSILVVGFLGAWENWDNNKRSVRKLALKLREEKLPGVWVETAGNHDRATMLRFIRDARPGALILYGQSFGGAAVVKLAREVNRLPIPVLLTVQVDSVGRNDALIPPNVARALNLYQHDPGPIWGRGEIRAVDPSRTRILGNVRFTYIGRDVEMRDYPPMVRRLGVAHWKMDNDPAVWKAVEIAIRAEIEAWRALSYLPLW